MSDKKPTQNNNEEEVDLGQLFNAIGKLFEKLFLFIRSIFKGIFVLIIYCLKPVVTYIKIISIVVVLTAILGYILDKYKKPVYFSKMLVKPYFESKYQLANNIDYFNALISSSKFDEISNQFQIDSIQAKQLVFFELETAPETKNEIYLEYDSYLKDLDSVLAAEVTFEDYIENRDIMGGQLFSIRVESHDQNIFNKLEKGFERTFENNYSKKLKNVRDSSLLIKKASYEKILSRLDSLQKTYLDVLKSESETPNLSISGNGQLPLINEKAETREYDLFQEELKVREEIRNLDEILIEESEFYDTLSNFENIGTKQSRLTERYVFKLPILCIIFMIISFMSYKAFIYVKNYEIKKV